MYRSLLFRCLPIRQIKKECVSRAVLKQSLQTENKWSRQLSVSVVCCKKRRTVEQKAAESHGRRVIRYSPKAGAGVVGVWRGMTVRDLAHVLDKDVDHVYRALEFADKTSGARYAADSVVEEPQVVRDVVKISGFRFKFVPRPGQGEEEEENRDALPAPPAPAEALRPRPPVVCVMGHVDHGKTTLLDALRDSRLVDLEFGGITQHIGAFEVQLASGERATFLDTPGHAAFSGMRARGARGADVVVLVVAADDGVMQQTVESIRMAREAAAPVLVAINKIDKPGVNIVGAHSAVAGAARRGVRGARRGGAGGAGVGAAPARAGRARGGALGAGRPHGPEGGARRARGGGRARGAARPAHREAGDGAGVAGLAAARRRARGRRRLGQVLYSAEGRPVPEAGPATPVRVLGWRELPAAGDYVIQVSSEKRANEVMRWRRAARMRDKQEADVDAIGAKEAAHQSEYKAVLAHKRSLGRMRLKPEGPRQKELQEDTHPTLRLLVKGDVDGSVEAILDLLDTYEDHERVRLDLVHFGVGPLTPNDLEIAEAFGAVVYAFNVAVSAPLAADGKRRGVRVREHNVIYRLADDVRAELSARLPVRHHEELLGEANVLQQFEVSEGRRRVPVAGARCVRGALQRHARYRVLRGGQVVYEGKLASMKHLKEEVSTIKRDMECGLRFEDPQVEVRLGDTVVCYRMVEVRDTIRWDPGF